MDDEETIETYNRYADVYDKEVIEFWSKFPKAFIAKFAFLSHQGRILNVGSGSGRDALLLKEQGLDVVCLDASSAMIALTKKLGFESILARFEEINFPSESFDGVWAYTSLIHIQTEAAVETISKLHAFLKPGSPFAIGVIAGDGGTMVKRDSMPDAERYFRYYSSQELISLIEPLGFRFIHEQNYQPHNSIYINQIYTKQ